MNQQKYILIFSLANVQNFIAQARKTQDLNQGSRMLSSIVKQVIDFIVKELGKEKVTFITPAHAENRSIPSRFVVELDASEEKAASLPKELYNFVMEVVRTMASDKFGKGMLDGKDNTIKAQIENFLDLHCLLYPRTADYKADYKNAEAHLGAIKNARLFEQIDAAGETGRKCILCGERNVVFYRKNNKERRKNEEEIKWSKLYLRKGTETAIILDPKAQGEYSLGELGTGEGICSVCALKRFKLNDDRFPSTAELALLGLVAVDEKRENAIAEYRHIFDENPFNWQFIYEENIRSKETMKKLGYFADSKKYQEIAAGHRIMTKKLKSYCKQSLGELPKYYAMVLFDGDSMGDLFSGRALDEAFSQEEGKLQEFQRALSGLLLAYAGKLEERYQCSDHAHKTKMIYSGGDDFLGFINLQFLFEELEFLRNEFEEVVSAPIFKEYGDYMKGIERISFSAGIVIAHYKTPLSIVIQETFEAEKRAKNIDKYGTKNAFCLCLLRRGGNQVSTLWHWNAEEDANEKILPLFKKLWQHLTNGELSPRFYSTLHQEFSLLLDDEKTKEALKELEGLLDYEFHRILLRAKAADFKAESIRELIESLLSYHKGQITLKYDYNNLLRMFEIIAFIERHTYGALLEPTKMETT